MLVEDFDRDMLDVQGKPLGCAKIPHRVESAKWNLHGCIKWKRPLTLESHTVLSGVKGDRPMIVLRRLVAPTPSVTNTTLLTAIGLGPTFGSTRSPIFGCPYPVWGLNHIIPKLTLNFPIWPHLPKSASNYYVLNESLVMLAINSLPNSPKK